MTRRSIPALGLGLLAAFAGGALLGPGFPGSRTAPVALGQTSSAAGGFLLGTEKAPDGAPVCFILESEPPHLLVYRIDNGGQLYLTASRDIHCDLKIEDRHIPVGNGAVTTTRPPVREVCGAVDKKLPSKKAEGKAGEKPAEKPAAPEEPEDPSGAEEK